MNSLSLDSGKQVLAHVDGKVGIITIDRPEKRNALTLEMALDVRRIAEAMDDDPGVWVILLRSSGDRAFCAGGDMVELVPKVLEIGSDAMNPDPASRFLTEVFTPIVCAVQGPCIGAGMELLLGTDIRIASERATFGLPEVGMGLISGGGSNVLLPQQIGWVNAMELILTGDVVDSSKAKDLGLVSVIVPHDEVQNLALDRAHRLATNGPMAMRSAKEIAARSRALAPSLERDHRLTAAIIQSEDAAHGMAAARAGTAATFQNR